MFERGIFENDVAHVIPSCESVEECPDDKP
jgi:hypothetical protein